MPMNRQKLIEDNINLVYFLIHTYYPRYATDEDIVQCGMIGLCTAADGWDESRSTFSTYASRAILNAIAMEFKRRKIQIKTLSLDYPMGEEEVTFGDLLVGESDVQYFDTEDFRNQLSPREKECFDLLVAGLTPTEIGRKLGLSRQNVNYHLRKLRLLWEKTYGN